MPPELARTTWGWVSLTTPEETLTIAEPERYSNAGSCPKGDIRGGTNRGSSLSTVILHPAFAHR